MKDYGMELIIDLHECDISKFTRKNIDAFFEELTVALEMTPSDRYFWDWKDIKSRIMVGLGRWKITPKTNGITATLFWLESNCTIHTLCDLRDAFVNIFSCKKFDVKQARLIAKRFFGAKKCYYTTVKRGRR